MGNGTVKRDHDVRFLSLVRFIDGEGSFAIESYNGSYGTALKFFGQFYGNLCGNWRKYIA